MKNKLAYLPPEGSTLVTDTACYLVFLPNDRAYRGVFWGAYSQLAEKWRWEETDPVRLEEIEQSWLGAIDQTLECLQMGCLENLTDMMQQVRDAIYATACCDPLVDPVTSPGGGSIYPSDNVAPLPSSGTDLTDSSTIPVTDFTDWDDSGTVTLAEFREYLCYGFNFILSSYIDWLRFTRFMLTVAYNPGAIGDWFLRRVVNRLLPTYTGDFALFTAVAFDNLFLETFRNMAIADVDQAIADLEAAKEDIICVLQLEDIADNAQDAFETILASTITNATVLAYLTSGPIGALFHLVFNGVLDMAGFEDYDCDCSNPVSDYDYLFFDSNMSWERWTRSPYAYNAAMPFAAGDGSPSPGSIGTVLRPYVFMTPVLTIPASNRVTVTWRSKNISSFSSGITNSMAWISADGTVTYAAGNYVTNNSWATETLTLAYSHPGGDVRLAFLPSMNSTRPQLMDTVSIRFYTV